MKGRIISRRPWLLMPVETKVRELESKVLLGCVAAENGFGVLLGRNGFNLSGIYPKGIYFDKCISAFKEQTLDRQVNELGNILVSLDEEGLIYTSEDHWLSTRVSKKTLSLSSLIFTWGQEQYRMLSKVPGAVENLVNSGSPRVDIWRLASSVLYRDQVRKLNNQFGNFILIPSNFALGTDFEATVKRERYLGLKKIENWNEGDQVERIAHYKSIYEYMARAIPVIAEESQDSNIVVRPHPADDISVWKARKRKWPKNVHVVYEGVINPWIKASGPLVHNNCTSAVEAFAMGKLAIAYTPLQDVRFDFNLPNRISEKVDNLEGLLELIKIRISHSDCPPEIEKENLLNRFINEPDGELASDHIIRTLMSLNIEETEFNCPSPRWVEKRVKRLAREVKRTVRSSIQGQKTGFTNAYRKQKNPGISLAEVAELISVYREIFERWQSVQVCEVDQDVFCIFLNDS